MNLIPFNVPTTLGNEVDYFKEVIESRKFCGDGVFTEKCHNFLERYINCKKALLTTSCTHALELCALLLDIAPGDEVIMPSYTFVSSANPFVLRGATVVFVDIDPITMNIDPGQLEKAITNRTKLIVVVHYAGVPCEMDHIMDISAKFNLPIVEDAAQCMGSFYKNKHLGVIGDFGCISFHETKNLHCGEGGALIINNQKYIERAEILREKGTNRKKFLQGQVDKYSWVDIGSSYLPSELNAGFLYCQLLAIDEILNKRQKSWDLYFRLLSDVKEVTLPQKALNYKHNAHIFFIKTVSPNTRKMLIQFLREKGIQSAFHYTPLHSSISGQKYCKYISRTNHTTIESEKILRLPLFFQIEEEQIVFICQTIKDFFIKSL